MNPLEFSGGRTGDGSMHVVGVVKPPMLTSDRPSEYLFETGNQ